MLIRSLVLGMALTTTSLLLFPGIAWSCEPGPTRKTSISASDAPDCLKLEGMVQSYLDPSITITNNCTEPSTVDCLTSDGINACNFERTTIVPGNKVRFVFPQRSRVESKDQQDPYYILTFKIGAQSGKVTVTDSLIDPDAGPGCRNDGSVECSLSQAPGMPTQTPWWVLSSLAGAAALIGWRRTRSRLPID
jgi:hypothetical protein